MQIHSTIFSKSFVDQLSELDESDIRLLLDTIKSEGYKDLDSSVQNLFTSVNGVFSVTPTDRVCWSSIRDTIITNSTCATDNISASFVKVSHQNANIIFLGLLDKFNDRHKLFILGSIHK